MRVSNLTVTTYCSVGLTFLLLTIFRTYGDDQHTEEEEEDDDDDDDDDINSNACLHRASCITASTMDTVVQFNSVTAKAGT